MLDFIFSKKKNLWWKFPQESKFYNLFNTCQLCLMIAILPVCGFKKPTLQNECVPDGCVHYTWVQSFSFLVVALQRLFKTRRFRAGSARLHPYKHQVSSLSDRPISALSLNLGTQISLHGKKNYTTGVIITPLFSTDSLSWLSLFIWIIPPKN